MPSMLEEVASSTEEEQLAYIGGNFSICQIAYFYDKDKNLILGLNTKSVTFKNGSKSIIMRIMGN